VRAADIDVSFTPRRAASAFTVELDGEAVLLDEDLNRLHHLNVTATVVWSCFDGSGSIGEIAHDLAAAFDSPPETMTADVLTLARVLGAQGLLADVDHDPEPAEQSA
jgi:hypothetical protein